MMATAVGYLRSDISGGTEEMDKAAIKALAERYKYELVKIVVHSNQTDDPVQRLINTVQALRVEAVFAPSLSHFGGQLPARLVRVADLNTVAPECTYARSYALLDASPPTIKETNQPMQHLPTPGPDGNAGGNSNPGEPSKDPLNLYGTAGKRSDKALSPVPQPDRQ